jgi:hypothetical protein
MIPIRRLAEWKPVWFCPPHFQPVENTSENKGIYPVKPELLPLPYPVMSASEKLNKPGCLLIREKYSFDMVHQRQFAGVIGSCSFHGFCSPCFRYKPGCPFYHTTGSFLQKDTIWL